LRGHSSRTTFVRSIRSTTAAKAFVLPAVSTFRRFGGVIIDDRDVELAVSHERLIMSGVAWKRDRVVVGLHDDIVPDQSAQAVQLSIRCSTYLTDGLFKFCLCSPWTSLSIGLSVWICQKTTHAAWSGVLWSTHTTSRALVDGASSIGAVGDHADTRGMSDRSRRNHGKPTAPLEARRWPEIGLSLLLDVHHFTT
jgi:hypothetical protein